MKLFNRKNKQTSDIDDYYASQRRQRVGVAWLLAGATLVVTLLLAAGLFYGGRWVYREVFDDNGDVEVVEEANEANDAGGETTQDDSSDDIIDNLPLDEEESGAANGEGGSPDAPELPSSNTQESQDTSTPEETPRTGPSSLPATGPTEPEL